MVRRGRNIGHDLTRRHAALAFCVDDAEPHRGRRLTGAAVAPDALGAAIEAARVAAPRLLISRADDSGVVLIPLDDAAPPRAEPARAAAEQFRAHLNGVGTEAISLGIGGIAAGPRELSAAAERARQALSMGRQLFGPGRTTSFEELGVRRLLFELRGEAMERFHREVLGALSERDRRTGGELIRTLDAYFAAGCSPTLAAERLHLHRNGMNYRLQRIRELLPLGFDDPEQRLALHVALRIGEVLQLEETVHRAQLSMGRTGSDAQ